MRVDPRTKYQPFEPVALPKRRWPDNVITKPPVWCSVDLRDGNQALADPMGHDRKELLWNTLVEAGFKEIEVGFPSASQTDFDFMRFLIENNRIPEDVTVQVLVPARAELIARTFESLKGCRRAIVHLYNSTSTLQRRVVFKMDKQGIINLAVEGAKLITEAARHTDTEITMQYSPESFTGTELDFAVEICEAVMDVWQATPTRKIIFNLPATVEMATPNVYADQIEWFSTHIKNRESIILSLHPHNDRGTAVAAAELAVMAGADRIEGTLFGNGERTGNVDVVTLALNMFSQGVDPGLDFSNIKKVVDASTECTRIPVHVRHPYAGDLVFAAFSGSHQDAIKKGLAAQAESNSGVWQVPYLPIDPADVGREYEPVIRINSQSGKGGIAFVLEQSYGVTLPPELQKEFSKVVQVDADINGVELTPERVWGLFEQEYLRDTNALHLEQYSVRPQSPHKVTLEAGVVIRGKEQSISGIGNGPIDAYCHALQDAMKIGFDIVDFQQKARTGGADAKAAAYVQIQTPDGRKTYGVGIDEDIVLASLSAVTSAVNRAFRTTVSKGA